MHLEIEVKKTKFFLCAGRALFWPDHQLLVVSDFHLGKAETFQRHGFPVPSQPHGEDLARLTVMAEHFNAKHIMFLGDLVPSRIGLTAEVVAQFARWLDGFQGRVSLVIGNHDRPLMVPRPTEWSRVDLISMWQSGCFVFQHEMPGLREIDPAIFYWVGHAHPTFRWERGPEHLRLPCFAISEDRGLLPAFSSAVGGFDIDHQSDWSLYPIGEEKVFCL